MHGSWRELGYPLLALALALFSFGQLRGDRPAHVVKESPAPPTAAETKPPPATVECKGSAQKLIDDFRGIYPGAAERGFRHLVVLIPDPVELGTREHFDEVLEGVEEAVGERRGKIEYVRDRAWFPWDNAGTGAQRSKCLETEPGIVLYRPSTGDGDDPLMVLLVGETPTWGVRTEPLKTALQLVKGFGCRDCGPYRILGPAFSGSASSLAAILRDTRSERAQPVTIDSGTATHPGVRDTLAGASDTYRSEAPSDDELLRAMAKFLETRGGRGGPDGNMVLFTESGTTYGAIGSSDDFRVLKFPPNLAAIRRAYEAVEQDPAAPMPLMRAPLADDAHAKGKRDQDDDSAAGHALALGGLLRDLSSKRVRFAGIMATDARDVVFLAEKIHEQLPDVRLFTLRADILYLHQSFAHTLNGMLVAHAARIPPDELRSTVLESEVARGVYRAGRRLFGDQVERPAVNISFIGNGALWQLSPDCPPPQFHVPFSWYLILLLFGTVLVFVVIAFLRCGRLGRRSWFSTLTGRCVHPDLEAEDVPIVGMLLVVCASPCLLMLVAQFVRDGQAFRPLGVATFVALSCAMISLPIWYVSNRTPGPMQLSNGVLWALASLAALFSLILGVGPQREATFNLLSGGSPVLAGLIGMCSFAMMLWCMHVRLHMLDTHRFDGPSSTKKTFAEMEPPVACALGKSETDADGLYILERDLLSTLKDPWTRKSIPFTLLLLFVVSVGLPFLVKPPQTFEDSVLNWFLILFTIIAAVPVLTGLTRLLANWRRLMPFLARLATSTAMAGLARLPAPLGRSLEAQLATYASGHLDLTHPVEALGRLAALSRDLADSHARGKTLLARVLAADALDEKPAERSRLVSLLIDTAFELNRSEARQVAELRGPIDDFTATLVAIFVPRYLQHFRVLLQQLLFSSTCLVLMTSLYFVQPQRLIASIVFVWIVAIVSAAFVVYLSLDRDPVISAIAKTPAHKVSMSFALVRRSLAWVIVPLASFFSVDHPELGTWLTNLIDVFGKGLR